jgi:hypothetical protein
MQKGVKAMGGYTPVFTFTIREEKSMEQVLASDIDAELPEVESKSFRKELEFLINCHSKENGCNTPDFILAEYLADCLEVFDKAVNRRESWYGREVELPSVSVVEAAC